MEIVHVRKSDYKEYENFVSTSMNSAIEQSISWKYFQANLKNRRGAGIVAVKEYDQFLMSAAYTIIPTVLGKNYLHVNRGPIFHTELFEKGDLFNVLSFLQAELERIGKKNDCIYIRFDFGFGKNEETKFDFDFSDCFKPAHYSFQPKRTLILDLKLTEKEILKQMKQKGRYNIKVAEKNNIEVFEDTSEKGLDEFYRILKDTAYRDHFATQPKEYYLEMLKQLSAQKLIKIYLARYSKKIIAANIVTFFGKTATYYYGASSNEYRNVMAPYLLQWRAICDAKSMGFKWYDFLGIAENNSRKHPLFGVTSFKRKFGGQDFDYANSREVVLQNFNYYLIISAKKAKNLAKKLFW